MTGVIMMRWRRQLTAVLGVVAASIPAVPVSVAAQGDEAARRAYFGAVAEHFGLPASEVDILGDWPIPADEIPVVLYVARRAGVSPEALVVLRRSGTSWAGIARRYGLGAGAFHLPLPEGDAAGRLRAARDRFASTPRDRWGGLALSDNEIVALVNVRVLSEALALPVASVLERVGPSGSFVSLFWRPAGS